MRIRAYRPEDAPRLEVIFRRAVAGIGSQHYSSEQVSAWAGPRVNAKTLDGIYTDGRTTFIAVDNEDRAIAFSDLEANGHIDMLYCDPGHARRGVASRLLAAIEARARRDGIPRLYTEASEAAKPVFARAGFRLLHRRDIEVGGVAIHNWAMEKRLS